MAQQIGFNELFNKASFDQGVSELVKVIGKITEEIELAELAGRMLSETLGRKVKAEIASLSATSKTLSKDIADITAKMDAFKATNVKLTETTKAYEKEVERLTKELEKLKQSQQRVNTETEKGTKAKSNMAKVSNTVAQSFLGIASGAAIMQRAIQTLREQLQQAVQATIDFEQAMKEVQAISRASDEQLVALTNNANKLGASTEKTASQVAELQKELAKLGFTSTEIIAASQAIVDLSTATGEDLAGSAVVVAATLRAFGLSASETTRVVDTMAGSFVRSGLDLEKFRESMKLVAPIARAVNVDVETTTAALSKLADAGLSGSLAGTALRNLLSEMADPTSKLSEFLGYTVNNSEGLIKAFKDLRDRGVDLAQAVQMIDVRARPAFFTLLNQIDAVENLSKEYRSLSGEGERIALLMRDTLKNDIEIANSAFDAMRRNLVEGYTPAMREAVQTTTTVIEGIRLFNEGALFQDSILVDLIGKYVEMIKTLYPLSIAYNVVNSALSLFGVNLGSVFDEINVAAREEKFSEIFKQGEAAIQSFNKSTNLVDFSRLADRYEELNGRVNKTVEESKQLEAIETELRKAFGETANAINKVTGERFLNIEAIQRTIRAASDEAKVTRESYQNRLQEIEAKIALHKANVDTLRLQGKFIEAMQLEASKSMEITDLLREKDIILKVLNTRMTTLVDTSVNGWSVYKDGATGAKKALDELADAQEKAEQKAKEAAEARKKAFDDAADKNKKLIDRQILETKLSEEATEMENKFLQERIDGVQEYIDKKNQLKETQEDIAKSMSSLEKELLAEDKKTAEAAFEVLDKFNKKKVKSEEEKWDETVKVAERAAEGLALVSRAIFDNRQIERDNELNAIDAWEKERIRLAGDNDEAIAAIEKEAEERRRKVAIQQAKDNKKEAMFQIILSTAVAVMRTLEKGAGFFSTPLAVATAAFGAAQLAVVANRPLPQFEKGTNYSPEGRAIVGEAGSELIIDGRTKQARLSPDRASITHLSKGSQVIPAHITQKLLTDPNFDYNGVAEKYLNKSQVIQIEKESIDYSRFGAEVREAIKEIPINQTNFDERGVTNYVVKRNVRLRRLNKRY